MAEKTIIGWGDDSGGAGGLTSAGGVQYWPLGGGVQATESWAQSKMRGACTLLNMRTRVLANTLSTSPTTVVTRINGGSGNLTVSVGSSVTGAFNDLTHTDTIAAGDLLNFMATPAAAGTGSLTFGSIVVEMDTTGQTFTQLFGKPVAATVTVNQNVTTFFPYVGKGQNSVDNIASWPVVEASATISDAQVRVKTNTASGAATIKSRKNGADGNILISITAASTGLFEDTTHTDSVVAGDLINFTFNTAAGTGSVIYTQWSVKHTGVTANRTTIPAKDTGHFVSTASQTLHGGPWAAIASLTSAPFADVPFAATVSGMTIRVNTNTRSTASTVNLRKAGSNANQTISITASTTGQMSDATHTDTYAAGDSLNFTCATGTGTGNLSVDSMALIFQAPQTFNQSALGASSPTASLSQSVTRAVSLLASATVAAIIVRANAAARSASTAPIASLLRAGAKALLAASAPVVTALKSDIRAPAASSVPVASLSRQPAKIATASASGVGTLTRSIAAARQALSAAVASLVRSSQARRTASSAPVSALVRSAGKVISVNEAPVASASRANAIVRRANATATASAIAAAIYRRTLQAAGSGTASLLRAAAIVRSVSVSSATSIRHDVSKRLSASAATVTSVRHAIAWARQASASVIASLTPSALYLRAYQATSSPNSRLVRSAVVIRTGAASAIGSLVRQPAKIAQATSSPQAQRMDAISKYLSAAASAVGLRNASLSRALSIATAVTAGLTRSAAVAKNAATSPVATQSRITLFVRSLLASATAQSTIIRSVIRRFSIDIAPASTIVKGVAVTRSAAAGATPSVSRGISHSEAASAPAAATRVSTIGKPLTATTGPVSRIMRTFLIRRAAVASVEATVSRAIGLMRATVTAPFSFLSKIWTPRTPSERSTAASAESRFAQASPESRLAVATPDQR